MDTGKRREPEPGGRAKTEAEKIATLTSREREVIALMGEGLKDKQIAALLSVTDGKVRHYLASTYEKLGTSDRLDLLLYAYHHGLARMPGSEGPSM
jgi:DNA-binding NarL/FixJ family response regulator